MVLLALLSWKLGDFSRKPGSLSATCFGGPILTCSAIVGGKGGLPPPGYHERFKSPIYLYDGDEWNIDSDGCIFTVTGREGFTKCWKKKQKTTIG